MKRLIISVILCFMAGYVSAQTIYHYKKVAVVNPSTGEKKSANSNYSIYAPNCIHIIFESNNKIWDVKEDGEKGDDFIPAEDPYYTYRIVGHNGQYKYESSENGISVYHCFYGYEAIHTTSSPGINGFMSWNRGDSVKHIIQDSYYYVSGNRQKINKRCKEMTFNGSEVWGEIYVYELFDTDEKGALPTKKSADPSHPTSLY